LLWRMGTVGRATGGSGCGSDPVNPVPLTADHRNCRKVHGPRVKTRSGRTRWQLSCRSIVLTMKAGTVIFGLLLGIVAVNLYSQTRGAAQRLTGPTVEVPEFAIAVKLSPKAEQRLRSVHESVKVIAYFDGDPLPGQGKYNPPNRDVFLGSDEKLADSNNLARFDHSRIPQSDWNRLADKNYFVTINTVSARRTTRDNLLDCADPISRRIETFRGKTIEIQCWLIGESGAPTK
jgi:hypothetical protein